MFKVNEANWDRIARVVLGIVLLVLGLEERSVVFSLSCWISSGLSCW